jgi:hypothetical protein
VEAERGGTAISTAREREGEGVQGQHFVTLQHTLVCNTLPSSIASPCKTIASPCSSNPAAPPPAGAALPWAA